MGGINVTSFSSISYYSNVRLISKIELEQNFQSIILDVHASANERPPQLFSFLGDNLIINFLGEQEIIHLPAIKNKA